VAFQLIFQIQDRLKEVERNHIPSVLEQTHWKVSGKENAIEIPGFNRSTQRAKTRKFDISQP